jgi:hypothetical protein
MRKRIATPTAGAASQHEKVWLDLNKIAEVEISSEIPGNPIEFALIPCKESGWSAAQSGEQTIRLLFDEPQKVKHIRLVFIESKYQRTQEFILRWSKDGLQYRDIARQQYNFSPPSTEVEEYDVNLEGVKALEMKIVPDISGGPAIASLAELRLA